MDLHLLEQCHFGQMREDRPKIQLKAWGRVQEVNISPPLLILNIKVGKLKGLHLKANILQAEASGRIFKIARCYHVALKCIQQNHHLKVNSPLHIA